MLISLAIRNVVTIDSLEITFGSGLTVLTGETGAGKSILLDSLNFVLGGRPSPHFIRLGESEASVSAHFSGAKTLRRDLTMGGKTRAFCNEKAVTAQFLKSTGWVDIHGQFDGLIDANSHRDLIDIYGNLDIETVKKGYHYWQCILRQLDEIAIDPERQAFLKTSLEEFERIAPQKGEEEKLLDERHHLMQQEKRLHSLQKAYLFLTEDPSILSRLNQSSKELNKFIETSGALEESMIALERGIEEIENLLAQSTEGKTLDQVEERLFSLRQCARKHQCLVEDLADIEEFFRAELVLFRNSEETMRRLLQEGRHAKSAYDQTADDLSEKRRLTAVQFCEQLHQEFPALKLSQAQLFTHQTLLEEGNETGKDRIEFYIQTHAGGGTGPLGKIASGGELSRIMLAMKVVLNSKSALMPTLVFDEIDTGLGGAVASAVGARLKDLAKKTQVLAVTHSPQLAAYADHHWHVERHTVQGKTMTSLALLEEEKRQEEIARMLSGNHVTDQARQAAKQLIQDSKNIAARFEKII